MIVNINTKIAAILKHHPAALEAIVSISPKFSKLRNPILRKVIAGRASIGMASKLGGCTAEDFFEKLQPLGFEIDRASRYSEEIRQSMPKPGFLLNAAKLVELDVRASIAEGKDPLPLIMQRVKSLAPGDVLKLINSFEPTPLIHLLTKQGFESYVEQAGEELYYTYFHKQSERPVQPLIEPATNPGDWDELASRYNDLMETIDVRDLEMPLPMHAILDALDRLPEGRALFVYHKRIPVFLLPELAQRQLGYRIREVSENEVHLIIFRD